MTEYSKLTVIKLKDELKQRGLPQTGLKAVLVARLTENDANADANADANNTTQEQENAASGSPTRNSPEHNISSSTTEAEPLRVNQDAVLNSAEPLPESEQAVILAPNVSKNQEVALPAHPRPEPELEPEPQPSQIVTAASDTPAILKPDASARGKEPDSRSSDAESTMHIDDQEKSLEKQGPNEPAAAVAPSYEAQNQASPILVEQEIERIEEIGADPAVPSISLTEEESLADTSIKPHDASYSRGSMTPLPTTESQPPSRQDPVDTAVQPSAISSDTQEAQIDDSRKRKRRSRSPQPSTQDVAMKKLKAEEGSPTLKTVKSIETQVLRPKTDSADSTEPLDHPVSPAKPSSAGAKFKSLFATPTGPSYEEQHQGVRLNDRDVTPAIHPATTALYIRNFMRPLQAATLKDYLTSLSHPGAVTSEQAVVTEFFLDSIKTHCLVQFADIAAASRVRLALHDIVWPDERSRKALWVDYIPEEKIKKWIEVERDAAQGRLNKRWEVVYEKEGESIAAYLQEAESGTRKYPAEPSRQGKSVPATLPIAANTKANIPVAPRGDSDRGFKALDDLFKSTTAKPKLYFQPVSASVANRRLGRLSEGRGGGRSDELRRYTFEEEKLVDNGGEFGHGWRGGARGRGGFAGGYPARGVGYRGR